MGTHSNVSPSTVPTIDGVDADVQVLHVDDDPDFVDLAAECIEREHDEIDVTTRTDPRKAIETIVASPPGRFDCVLSDYDMPGMNGLELLDTLCDHGCSLPFVLFTGKGSEEIASEAFARGAADYIQKEGGISQYDIAGSRILDAVSQYRAERRLERNERHYRRLVESAPAPITMYDEDGIYVYANRAATAFFGVDTVDELIGKSKFDFIDAEEHEAIKTRLGQLTNDREIPTSEHVYVDADGERKHGVASCAPASYHDEAVGVSIIRETTDAVAGSGRSKADGRRETTGVGETTD